MPGIIGFQLVGDLNPTEAAISSLSLLGAVGTPYELISMKAKIFTAVYGLFIEAVFFLSMATLLAPIIHWLLHKLHIKTESTLSDHKNDLQGL